MKEANEALEKEARKLALQLKSICYFDPFRNKFGDWLAAGNEFMELEPWQKSEEKRNIILRKHHVIIDLDDGFEPVLTEEILEFLWEQYHKLFNNKINN